MTILDRLERHLSRFAVPNLIRYVVALNALVFVLVNQNPEYVTALTLDRNAILQGQVWRLVSWIFIPQDSSLFYFFYLMFLWWLGDLLEATWGAFRLNLYYLTGIVLCVASALIFGASQGNLSLNLSVLLAVATLAPNLEILILFVIPLKLKWLALVSLLWPMQEMLRGPLAARMIVIMCLANYLIFFGPMFIRRGVENRSIQARRSKFEAAKLPVTETLHRCEVCGATEDSQPDAEFRVSADGHEYCLKHLPSRN